MPLSYATYTGNGSTTTFSVPFPYLLKSHVKVFIGFNILTGTYTSELVEGVGFTWSSGTQVQCTTAPTAAQTLTVIRQTPSSSRIVDWNDGSNLIAADMDTADLQNLYVVQEQQDRNDAGISASLSATTAANTATTAANTATSTANTALSTANTALTNANTAVSTANTASTNASAAVTTANTASTNASAAVTTANTASTNASAAVTTANAASATATTASTNASTALTTANTAATDAATALSTANTASSNASAAVTTANTASTNASAAVTTANTASTNASAAVSTANTASTNASAAVTTANLADSKADQAIAAVAAALLYTIVANVAAIPGSPSNGDAIEITDSTGIESFTPLTGLPSGFVGDSGLGVRLTYQSSSSSWVWAQYFAQDPENRYAGPNTNTGTAASPTIAFGPTDANTGIYSPGADQVAISTNGTGRLFVDASGNVGINNNSPAAKLDLVGNGIESGIKIATSIASQYAPGLQIIGKRSDNNTNTCFSGRAFLARHKTTGAVSSNTRLGAISFGGNHTDSSESSILYSASVYGESDGAFNSSSDMPTALVFATGSTGVAPNAVATPGTERLRITSAGLVGIGTSSPSYPLHVSNNAATYDRVLQLQSTNTSTLIGFGTSGGSGELAPEIGASGTGLQFNTQNTARMTIAAGGNVGIGTTTPATLLELSQSTSPAITLTDQTTANTFGRITHLNGTTLIDAEYNNGNGVIRFTGNNNTQEYGRFDTSGRLLVGTSSARQTRLSTTSITPSVQTTDFGGGGFFVYNSVASANPATIYAAKSRGSDYTSVVQSGDALFRISAAGADGTQATEAARITVEVDGTPGTNDMPGRIVLSTTADGASSPTERLRIDSTGKVGVGTASPGDLLHVSESSASAFAASGASVAQFERAGNVGITLSTADTGTSTVFFGDTTSSTIGRIQYDHSDNSLGLWSNSNERARIDSSGRLLVGTATSIDTRNYLNNSYGGPSIQQHGITQGNAVFAVYNWGNNSASPAAISLNKSLSGAVGTRGALTAANQDIGAITFLGDDGTSFIPAATIIAEVDGTPGANDMPGRIVLSTTADGASTPTERLRITSSGRLGLATTAPAATAHVAGSTIISNVDVANASYDSVSFSVATQENQPSGLFFSPDGRKMFVCGTGGDDINEYTLSTPWDASTATYVTVFSVASQDTAPQDLYFRNDGKKLFVVGSTNDSIYQYSLSTPWSIASASYDSVSFSVATEETGPTGLFFKSDGLAAYVVGNISDAVHCYNLTTAWDISTAALANSFSIAGQENNSAAVDFTADGSRMFVMGYTGDDVNIYDLTTPWDITTASFVTTFSVAAQEDLPTGLFVKPDGTKFFVVGQTNDTVYQYSIPSATIDLTGTTNINGNAEVAQDLTVRGETTLSGNLKFDSGYGSAATAYGCRAWVNFNGTGTVAIRASGNVSSITDHGVGIYTINFTTAMPDADYAMTGSTGNAGSTTGDRAVNPEAAFAAGSCKIRTLNTTTATDDAQVSVVFHR